MNPPLRTRLTTATTTTRWKPAVRHGRAVMVLRIMLLLIGCIATAQVRAADPQPQRTASTERAKTWFVGERQGKPAPPDRSRAYRVPALPDDNLVSNPWFRRGQRSSLDGWTKFPAERGWGASQKPGNPTPDEIVGTAARISTGRGETRRGKNIDIGVETTLSQVVSADPAKRTLKFDMYWVTHTVDPVEVTVYGGPSPAGPWTKVWRPFHQVETKARRPVSGRGQDLWKYYSKLTGLVSTRIPAGHPHYRIAIRASLPDQRGGLKITGVYFTVTDEAIAEAATEEQAAPEE